MPRVKVTAAEFQEKHARRLKGAIEDMRRGVDRVTEAPGAKAAAKKDKWHARISEASVADKWADRVSSVGLSEWKEKMTKKGLTRVAGGIDEAKVKTTAFASQLIAHQEAELPAIDEMADLTLEDGVARAAAWIRAMGKFSFDR